MPEINEIEELYPGHFRVFLDYPRPSDSGLLVDPEVPYVWVMQYDEYGPEWEKNEGRVFGTERPRSFIQSRAMKTDYLIATRDFIAMASDIKYSIHLVQVEEPPAHYMSFDKLRGASRYSLLSEKLGYRLEVEIPGASDIARMVSRDRSLLERAIATVAATG